MTGCLWTHCKKLKYFLQKKCSIACLAQILALMFNQQGADDCETVYIDILWRQLHFKLKVKEVKEDLAASANVQHQRNAKTSSQAL